MRVRVGIHTGEPGVGDHGYHGIDVVRAARISAAAHGGQVLVSATTASLLGESAELIDLGEHELEGLPRPERLYQLGGDDLAREFPPPRTGAAVEPAIVDRGDELAEAAQEALEPPRRRRLRIVAPAAGAVVAAVAAVALWAVWQFSCAAAGLDSARFRRPHRPEEESDRRCHPRRRAPGRRRRRGGGCLGRQRRHLTVTQIDAETRAVVKTIGIGAEIADVAVGDGGVWIANGNDERLTRIDPRENAVAERIDISRPGAAVPRPALFVAVGGGVLWTGTFDQGLLRIDPRTGSIERVVPEAGPVAVGKRAVWAGMVDRVARIDRRTNLLTTTLVATYPEHLAVGAGSAWAVVMGGIQGPAGGREASLWRLDPQDGHVAGTFSAGRDVVDVAVAAGSVWVASWTARDVRRIDARTGDLVATIPLGAVPTSLAYGDGVLWVTVTGRG